MEDEKKDIDIDEIEEGKLWLGSFDPENVKVLKEKGIKNILTIMDGDPSEISYKEHGFNQKVIDIMDYESKNIIQYFGECLNFLEGEEKVFVHCAAGISRSPTIVIAYIMWKNEMTFGKAYDFVKQKRPDIYPNYGFQKQLKMFEKLLFENDFDINNIDFKSIKWIPPEHSGYYSGY